VSQQRLDALLAACESEAAELQKNKGMTIEAARIVVEKTPGTYSHMMFNPIATLEGYKYLAPTGNRSLEYLLTLAMRGDGIKGTQSFFSVGLDDFPIGFILVDIGEDDFGEFTGVGVTGLKIAGLNPKTSFNTVYAKDIESKLQYLVHRYPWVQWEVVKANIKVKKTYDDVVRGYGGRIAASLYPDRDRYTIRRGWHWNGDMNDWVKN
jgi:hypothetical protein